MMKRIVCIGECMVELAPLDGGTYRQGFAGDTFNMAWYLRRFLAPDWQVDYLSAVGDDAMSARMVDFMRQAGIGTDHVAVRAGGTPGLYLISVSNGERSFSYWRGQSAARTLAADADALDRAFDGAQALVFSGITLAILPETDRQRLLDRLALARDRGARIVFDPNLRPRLWPDAKVMCEAVTRAAAASDLVLASFDDEAAAFGDASPEATAGRYARLGVEEVVVKNAGGPVHWSGREGRGQYQPAAVPDVVDSTAAGDSFNARFLAERFGRADITTAVTEACRVAAKVIGARGALVQV